MTSDQSGILKKGKKNIMEKNKMKNVTPAETTLAERPKLHLVEIEETSSFQGENVDFPEEIKDSKGRESLSDCHVKWEPETPGECLVGTISKINEMKLFGGLAVVFDMAGTKILLVKGGVVFEEKFSDPTLNLKRGDHVAVLYTGESEAQEGMNPARLWRIKKLN